MTTQTPSIGEQTHAFMAGLAEQVNLDDAGVPTGVSASGALMPDGELLDVRGAATSLAQVRAGRPAVVVFYRGAWCPFCNIALRTYQAELAPALADRGFVMIAVSPQKPDGSLSAAQTNELTYAVVSDPGNQLASALGILTEPDAEAAAAQQKLGLDLAEHNADGGLTLPMPTTVVVDAIGVIRWIDVHPNYTTRSEVPDILAAVDSVS
jgi:peroxiredoxin